MLGVPGPAGSLPWPPTEDPERDLGVDERPRVRLVASVGSVLRTSSVLASASWASASSFARCSSSNCVSFDDSIQNRRMYATCLIQYSR